MNYSIQLLFNIAIVCLLIYICTTIFGFFDISIQSYGYYLLFIVFLFLLYKILPTKKNNIFNNT